MQTTGSTIKNLTILAVSDELSPIVCLQKDTTLRLISNRIFSTLQKNIPAILRVYPYFNKTEIGYYLKFTQY
jgi:hypothetical protein